MASIILKWLRRCLFICVCAFFLMSHNASAVIATDEVRFINSSQSWFSLLANTTGMDCTAACTSSKNSNGDVGIGLNQIELSIPSGTYYSDTIFRYDIMLWKVSNSTSLHANMNNYTLGNSYMNIYDVEMENIDTNNSVIHFYFKFNQTFTIQNDRVLLRGNAAANSFVFYLNPQERISAGYWSQWAIVDTSVDTSSIVNAINSHDYTSSLNTINSGISSVNNNLNQVNNSINNINDDVKQDTQDAADEAADSGDQSAADAENATAGLISVIGGFVNAITSATPTNCKINGKINNSFNMGELDLCSMPVPPFVQIISSLILIAICIPFAIVMFNRFIGLFRSFQG